MSRKERDAGSSVIRWRVNGIVRCVGPMALVLESCYDLAVCLVKEGILKLTVSDDQANEKEHPACQTLYVTTEARI